MTSDPLAPLVAALLDRANRDAADVLAGADSEARATVDAARAEAEQLLADARAKGAADAADVLIAERSRAERAGRVVLLTAQQDAHAHAQQAARAAVRTLRDDPTYPHLLSALRALAVQRLGPAATITELPNGGIEATQHDQRLEFSLDGLADDLLDALSDDHPELWGS